MIEKAVAKSRGGRATSAGRAAVVKWLEDCKAGKVPTLSPAMEKFSPMMLRSLMDLAECCCDPTDGPALRAALKRGETAIHDYATGKVRPGGKRTGANHAEMRKVLAQQQWVLDALADARRDELLLDAKADARRRRELAAMRAVLAHCRAAEKKLGIIR